VSWLGPCKTTSNGWRSLKHLWCFLPVKCHAFSISYLVNPCSFFRNYQKSHPISASPKVVPESLPGILYKNNYQLSRWWHPVSAIQVADSWGGFGLRGISWPDDPSEWTSSWHHNPSNCTCQRSQSEASTSWHHRPNILARLSTQKQLPHDKSVIPNSLELWKVLVADVWLETMSEGIAIESPPGGISPCSVGKACHSAWSIVNMRDEFRVNCPLSALQLQHFHSPLCPSAMEKPEVQCGWGLCSGFLTVSFLYILKMYSPNIVFPRIWAVKLTRNRASSLWWMSERKQISRCMWFALALVSWHGIMGLLPPKVWEKGSEYTQA
jgi:hypothetical protein